jgi:protein-L-isoaspartate(D-aspartate) O-methyltransferase
MNMRSDEQSVMVDLIRKRGVSDPLVLQAMEKVPRHLFVPANWASSAYSDSPLPIGHQQTISQPYMVAMMTEALDLNPGNRVLDIGTGSGYQAAILAEMGMDVYSVERIPSLYQEAKARLESLNYDVHCRLGNGYEGWPEFAPYQGILVAAAPPEVPPPLLEQLADGGQMIIPLGPTGGYQTLWKFVKHGDQIKREQMGSVAFVPFVHNE